MDALGRLRAERAEEDRVDRRIDELGDRLRELEPACQPHDRAIDVARLTLEDANQYRRELERTAEAGWRERRSARRDLTDATRTVTTAEYHLDHVTQQTRPVLDQRAQFNCERNGLVHDVKELRVWRREIAAFDNTAELAEARRQALVAWKNWASGHPVGSDELAVTVETLTTSDRSELHALAAPLIDWLTQRGLETRPHGIDAVVLPKVPDLGIEL